MNTIEINKSIPIERWGEFFDQFSDGNRGRYISIEIMNSAVANETLIKNAPLLAMVYDPPKKGNDLTIEVGISEVDYAHTIDEPVKVLTGQDSNGKMMAVSITDTAGTQTLIKLQDS
jgi:Family of unknown function (DUF5335)